MIFAAKCGTFSTPSVWTSSAFFVPRRHRVFTVSRSSALCQLAKRLLTKTLFLHGRVQKEPQQLLLQPLQGVGRLVVAEGLGTRHALLL